MHERIREPIKSLKTAASEHIKAKFRFHLAKELYTPRLEFEAARRLGVVHHLMGHHEKAIRQFVMAVGLATALGIEADVVAELYFYLGDAFFWLECYDEMMAISSLGLSKLKQKSPPETMLLYENIRRAYSSKKDQKNAERYARTNQELIKEANYFPNIDRVYHGIAWTLGFVKDDLDYSLSLLSDGLKLCEENDDEVGICRCCHSIADALRAEVELKKAIAYYKRAIGIAERIGYEDMLIYSYADMGEALVMMETDFDIAGRYLLDAAGKAKQAGNNTYVAFANNMLAKIYRSTGNTVGLVEALAEFVKHGKAAFPRASIQALHELCVIHMNKGDWEVAAEYFMKGIRNASSSYKVAQFLDGLERCYDVMNKSSEFDAICRTLIEQRVSASKDVSLSQWRLSPGLPSIGFSEILFSDQFDREELDQKWLWLDPQRDCAYHISKEEGWLEISVPPNHWLWRFVNFDAPRVIQEIKGDFAVETSVTTGQKGERHGGMLAWVNSRNHISLEVTPEGNVHFSVSKEGEFDVIGRGRIAAPSVYLRLERRGNLFSALCGSDRKSWFVCGDIELVIPEPIDVGIYGVSLGDAVTTTRFGYFKIFIQGGTNA